MTYCENNTDNHWQWGIKKYFTNLFARIFLCMTIGVMFVEYTSISYLTYIVIALSFLTTMIISTFKTTESGKWIFLCSFPFFLIGLGGILAKNYVSEYDLTKPADINIEKYQTYVIDITSVPIKKKRYYKTEAKIRFIPIYINSTDSINDKGKELKQSAIYHNYCHKKTKSNERYKEGDKIILNIERDDKIREPKLGDRYIISTKINLPTKDYPEAFDYGRYLIHKGFVGTGWVSSKRIKLVSTNNIKGIRMHTYALRDKIVNQLRSTGIEENLLSILTSITIGEKSHLSDETKSNFTASGVSHILVVSGMHIGFIFLIIAIALRRIYANSMRIIFAFIGLILMWGYAVCTGLAPSVIRATFMFSTILIFQLAGTQYKIENALSISAVILLIFNPFVIFDVGFQLSYLAVISIAYFYPHFVCAIKRLNLEKHKLGKPIKWILLTASVSLSAQILTIPAVLYHFHQFPIYFIITNLIVSLLAPIIFIGGIILIPVSYIPHIGEFCGSIMSYILNVLNWSVETISSFPMAIVKQYISLGECLLCYIVILTVINWIETHKYYAERFRSKVFNMLSLILLTTTMLYNNFIDSNKERLTILNNHKLIINLCSTNENIIFTNADTTFVSSRLETLWLKYKAPKPKFILDPTLNKNTFIYNNETYMILRDRNINNKKNPRAPMQVDYLIIDKGIYPSKNLLKLIEPKRVILAPSVWKAYIPEFKKIFNGKNIEVKMLN